MQFLRGPYFLLACVLAAVIGVALGWSGYQRGWVGPESASLRQGAAYAEHYHRQAAFNRELEPTFRRMAEDIRLAFKPLGFVCKFCERSLDPGSGMGDPPVGSWGMSGAAGNFRHISLGVDRTETMSATFSLYLNFKLSDGRMEMNDLEKASFWQVVGALGLTTPAQKESIIGVIAAARQKAVSKQWYTRTIRVGSVTFAYESLPRRGDVNIEFRGPPPARVVVAPSGTGGK